MRVALIGRDGIEIGIETIDGVGPNGLWPTQMPFSLASREFEEGQLQCVREEKEEENLIMWTFCFSPRRIPTYSSVVSKLAVAYWRCDQKHSETQCSSCGLGVRNSLY